VGTGTGGPGGLGVGELKDNRLKIKKVTFSLLVILLSTGCYKSYPYYYISLEKTPDIQVKAYGKTQIGDTKFHKEMPIRYELKREQYILFFD
jgi:hypothetical protein